MQHLNFLSNEFHELKSKLAELYFPFVNEALNILIVTGCPFIPCIMDVFLVNIKILLNSFSILAKIFCKIFLKLED